MLRRTVLTLLIALAGVARADDHANQPAQGTWIAPGAALAGTLEPGDQDWFRFTAQAGARYRLETEGPAGDVDTLVGAWNASGTFVGEDDDSGPGRLSRLDVTTAVGGTWFARVRHYQAGGSGAYRLRLTLLVAPATPPPATPPATPATPPPAPPATPPPAATPASGALTLEAPRVFDPHLGAALAIESAADGAAAYQATLSVLDGAGAPVRSLVGGASRQGGQRYRDEWNGRDAQGRWLRPGRYTLRLDVARAGQTERTERALFLVRLGALAIVFLDRGDGSRVSLQFHRPDAWVSGNPFDVDAAGPAWTLARSPLGAGCLDAADGSALPVPDPWTDTARPPRDAAGNVATRGRSLPVAYALGASPRLFVSFGSEAAVGGLAVPAGWPIQGLPLRLVVGGPAAPGGVPSAPLVAGAQAQVDLPPQGGGVGGALLELELRYEYQEGGAWRPIPGLQRTRHGYYRLLGQPVGGQAWVAAVDLAARFAGGVPQDGAGLLAALVRGINGQQGLRYDEVQGASAYSDVDYNLDLGAYLDGQTHGRVINCSDCASLVSALANHCGADARVVTIGWNFSLHWIKGIGASAFGHSLFGGMHAFSYHDVASRDRGQTIHDACLSVDDDGQPWSAPFSERLPLGMPFDPYVRALSPDVGSWSFGTAGGPQVQGSAQVRVR